MPEALNRKALDGRVYERPPEIEACIVKLEQVDANARLLQFRISSRKNPDYVPSESIIYFLRQAWRHNSKIEFEAIFRILIDRIDTLLRSSVSNSRMANAQSIREEIISRFSERIAKDCTGNTTFLDFYEIRFDQAFAAFRKSTLRKIGPAAEKTVPLGSDDDEGNLEISAEVEDAAANFMGGSPSKLDDLAFRLELATAIDTLPSDQKHVIELLRQGYPIDSKDKSTMSIASILQCDERTVRNRRNRAFRALQALLVQESAQ